MTSSRRTEPPIAISQVPETHPEIEEITALSDDRVLIGYTQIARGRGQWPAWKLRSWSIHWVAKGLITRRQVFWTRDEALEAAGLRE